jgi:hypothetical protein
MSLLPPSKRYRANVFLRRLPTGMNGSVAASGRQSSCLLACFWKFHPANQRLPERACQPTWGLTMRRSPVNRSPHAPILPSLPRLSFPQHLGIESRCADRASPRG